ncbi:MAG: CPBP family intramembrane metalloprotease [Acidobacteria bacterium]|nr:CPBP family intramembrane metalloprotease [Acidobacteriota bacterium]
MRRSFAIPALVFAALAFAFWSAARWFRINVPFGPSLASLVLLLVPFWFFGFGWAEFLRARLPRSARVGAAILFVTPYLAFALPLGTFRWPVAAAMIGIAFTVAVLLEFAAPAGSTLQWQDALALAIVAAPILFGWFRSAWPAGGLGGFPKLLLTDIALYGFLVCRGLPGIAASGQVGYSFIAEWRDAVVGFREWLLFAPFGIGLGLTLHFIRFGARVPPPGAAAAAWLVTFFLVAVPEELFFRGLLLNLLLPRLGSRRAVALSSILFGLSHFNKGATFNWRYVTLASIAGVFYARAWLDRRRIFSSAITHTAVDVTWSLWFR